MHVPNHIVITPKPFGVDFRPPIPEVKAGLQPLLVSVDWSQNRGFWNRVEFHSLLDPAGNRCDVFPDHLDIPLGDGSETAIMFNYAVKNPHGCHFSVALHRVYPVETFTVDPGIIVKPGP